MIALVVIRESLGCYLIFTLAATGIAKMTAWRVSSLGVAAERLIPRRAAAPVIILVSIVEVLLSAAFALDAYPQAIGFATAIMFLSFGAYKVIVTTRTGRISCSCSGIPVARTVGRSGLSAAVTTSITQASIAFLWAVLPHGTGYLRGTAAAVSIAVPVAVFAYGCYRNTCGRLVQSVA
ncbi:MauE/DoxX family redox-associated membrane protein [Pseudonocardia sp. GCM10023141]|uniref:MauE/DoxX family redox-associated membrane protein n=1 Tax=Pseudonocardia sp. GCM10023141 TaxID=3252653 RepID=UPI00362008F8